ncbi:hypothetical protein EVAR_25649_1 [Eumeta japonica]|uniref:Uncharacterized protein n=1 Tax=Eumeta variegata TaxID=151549 RepID=A0A4C1Z4R0_EUMVA|nr:hypothetical protein EVAR_25649_1 [Eumeta japonica]
MKSESEDRDDHIHLRDRANCDVCFVRLDAGNEEVLCAENARRCFSLEKKRALEKKACRRTRYVRCCYRADGRRLYFRCRMQKNVIKAQSGRVGSCTTSWDTAGLHTPVSKLKVPPYYACQLAKDQDVLHVSKEYRISLWKRAALEAEMDVTDGRMVEWWQPLPRARHAPPPSACDGFSHICTTFL